MNVEQTSWAGQVPNPQQPLSSGLRGVYAVQHQLPAELLRLLGILDRPSRAR